MNNKKTITICSVLALIILAIVIVITFISDGMAGFGLILGALFIILTICLGIYLREAPDEYSAFIKAKKRILRTYDSIIVEVEDIPNIAGKNIIKVKTIEDLVDAQLELREPIYYKNDNDSCFFILLHYNEACIYILKMNEDVVSQTEQSIRYMKEDKEDKDNKKENILDNVENTIVYKLDELRSFKISPIRNENKIELVDDSAIKEELETAKESNISKETLEDEISKTMYIKNLKEKIRQYEEDEMSSALKEQEVEINVDNIEVVEDTAEENKKEEPTSDVPKAKTVKKTSKKSTAKNTKKKETPKKNTHQTRRATKYNSKNKNSKTKK